MKTLNTFLAFTFLIIIQPIYPQTGNSIAPFASGFANPVSIDNCGDGRLFIVNRSGTIYIIDSAGNKNPTPFLDIVSRVKSTGSEQGLLGLAFHPGFHENAYFYVNYTGVGDSSHISRFTVDENDPDIADPESEKKLMTIYQPFTNHNGGDVNFGPDGYLYLSFGDGGSGGDPGNRAQNLQTYLGKILRIDVDNGDPYAIPGSNPFAGNPSALDEIWAYGLRNPWRFSFDRLSGDLWIGDVGQTQYEEIDFQPASGEGGENYGWRCYEGFEPYNTGGCGDQSLYTFPVHTYSHTLGCSVTGGFVCRGEQFPGMYGKYFFADYCSGRIWTIRDDGGWVAEDFGQFSTTFSTFGENSDGELFVAGYSNGTIYRVVDNSSTLTLDLKVFLEGPYNAPGMSTGLNDAGLIPLGQPFNTTPWNYSGDEAVTAIPNEHVVDWILVEIRDAVEANSASSNTIVARQAAFLLDDGRIVATDGSSLPDFNDWFVHQLFVVIRHRNHLDVMSAYPLVEESGIHSYDFTTAPGNAFGSNSVTEVEPGVWGMLAGDSDANGVVDLDDKSASWYVEAGSSGYFGSDLDMDGQVDNRDKNEFWLKNLMKASQIPQ